MQTKMKQTTKQTKKPKQQDASSLDTQELSTERDWVEMLDPEASSLFPGRHELRKRLCYTLLKWSGQPGSLDIGQFCIKYRISYFTLIEWVGKFPDLARIYATAKYNLGTNRRVGVFEKRYESLSCYRDMHILDPSFDAINKYHANLKKDEAQQSHTYIVHVDKPEVMNKEELKGQMNSEEKA